MSKYLSERDVSDLLARAMAAEPGRKHVVPVGAALLADLKSQEQSLGLLLRTLLLPRNRVCIERGDPESLVDLYKIAEASYEHYKSLGGEWSLDECLSEGMKAEVARLNGGSA